MSTLRERLIEAREAAKLSQAQLAKLAHCGQTTIASIERGRNKGATPLPMLAHVLCVEALWLVDGKGPKRREDLQQLHDAVDRELSANVVRLNESDANISAVVALMRATDQTGKLLALGAVKAALAGHTQSSSKSKRCPVIDLHEFRRLRMQQ